MADTTLSDSIRDLVIWAIPIVILAIKSWIASREAKRAKSAEAEAAAKAAAAELAAEMERLATKAVVTGVMKLKEQMSEKKKQETNSTIRAITTGLGVEDIVHKIVEEVKQEKKDAPGK